MFIGAFDQMFKRHFIQNIITTTLLTCYYFLMRHLLVVVNFVFLILCFVSIYPQTLKCGCMKLTASRTMVGNTSLCAGDFSFTDFPRMSLQLLQQAAPSVDPLFLPEFIVPLSPRGASGLKCQNDASVVNYQH